MRVCACFSPWISKGTAAPSSESLCEAVDRSSQGTVGYGLGNLGFPRARRWSFEARPFRGGFASDAIILTLLPACCVGLPTLHRPLWRASSCGTRVVRKHTSEAASLVVILVNLVTDNRDNKGEVDARLRECRSIVLVLERAAEVVHKVGRCHWSSFSSVIFEQGASVEF